MSRLGITEVTRLTIDNPAIAPHEAVRLAEFEAALAAAISPLADSGHTHPNDHAALSVTGDYSLQITLVDQALTLGVRLDPAGGLLINDSGLACNFGSGAGQVMEGDTPGSGLNLGVADTNSVDLTYAGGILSAAVRRSSSGIRLAEDSGGCYIPLGDSGVAPHSHSHASATSAAAGFLSAADKRKLDAYGVALQVDHPAEYQAGDYLAQGDYLGGRKRWGQRMEVTGVNLTASAPTAAAVLELEVNGAPTGETITIPAGAAGVEVQAESAPSSRFIESGQYARWLCTSGEASNAAAMASRVHLQMNVRPALTTVPELRLNCGGAAVDPYAEDGYYTGGETAEVLGQAVDMTGVTDPAPEAVYRSKRYRYGSTAPLTYTLTGLGRGVDYKVRLHFVETQFPKTGDQKMKLEVIGATTQEVASYDVYAQTGALWKATVREFTAVRADTDGTIRVRITPLLNPSGQYNLAIQGVEVVAPA